MGRLICVCLTLLAAIGAGKAQTVADPKLAVRSVVSGLITPTTMAFLAPREMLIAEKNTGKVQHVVNGTIQNTVLDLAVNFASERGLLGIALDPAFSSNHYVYLYWTCPAAPPPAESPFV